MLTGIDLGGIRTANNIFLAPMAGITDKPFRTICRKFGCGFSFTVMISANGIHYRNRQSMQLADFRCGSDLGYDPDAGCYDSHDGIHGTGCDSGYNPGRDADCDGGYDRRNDGSHDTGCDAGYDTGIDDYGNYTGMQIFGKDPEIMAEAAFLLSQNGAKLIDINMGCPTPKIVKDGYGCALMRDPDLAGRIVKAVVLASRRPVTVKIRKGWDEDSVNAVETALAVQENGACAVTVHGRTRDQFYSGRADWGIIKHVKDALKIPVIGNGDIFSPEDAAAMLELTGCDAVMIGRGAQGNPWIFRQIADLFVTRAGSSCQKASLPGMRTDTSHQTASLPGMRTDTSRQAVGMPSAPSPAEKLQVINDHIDLAMDHYGEDRGMLIMRKHIAWYLKGRPNSASYRDRVFKAESQAEIKSILEAAFGMQDHLQQ